MFHGPRESVVERIEKRIVMILKLFGLTMRLLNRRFR